jgi:hypothetical protein
MAAPAALAQEPPERPASFATGSIPMPGSIAASPETSISILGVDPGLVSEVVVEGSTSGPVGGALGSLPGGDGVVFTPSTALVAGEVVTVTSGASVGGQTTWNFTVATPGEHPGLVLDDAHAHESSPGAAEGEAVTAASIADGVAEPWLRPASVTINTASSSAEDGYILATPRATGSSDAGIQMFDDSGELLWFREGAADLTTGDAFVDSYLGRPAIFWFEGTTPYGPGNYRGEWVVVDGSYSEVARLRMANGYQADIHDLFLTDRGSALMVAYSPVVCTGLAALADCTPGITVLDAVVQEVDLASGTVLFEWHSLDHVPLSDALVAGYPPVFDYFHINSVAEDTDGDILISARNTSALYKIDKTSGSIEWSFGGRSGSLAAVGDPEAIEGPDFPHHLRTLGGGQYSYFDNGSRRGKSRGAVFDVDAGAGTATYSSILEVSPSVFANTQGTMQSLPAGGFLVGWGGSGRITEYDAGGSVVFDATLGGSSYRQYRFEWSGSPTVPPGVASTASGGDMDVAMSWNGDTRTADWRVLTGASPTAMTTAATVAKSGFETTATVAAAPFVAVEALDGDGEVLGRSATVSGGAYFQEAAAPEVNGTYTTLVGDFAGSRNDDVVYYRPGTGADYLHVSNGDGTFQDVLLPYVNGSYSTPLVGDFVGDDRDEILWTDAGSSRGYMWRFDSEARGSAVSVSSAPHSVPAFTTRPFVLHHRQDYGANHDEVLWYGPGSNVDRID